MDDPAYPPVTDQPRLAQQPVRIAIPPTVVGMRELLDAVGAPACKQRRAEVPKSLITQGGDNWSESCCLLPLVLVCGTVPI